MLVCGSYQEGWSCGKEMLDVLEQSGADIEQTALH